MIQCVCGYGRGHTKERPSCVYAVGVHGEKVPYTCLLVLLNCCSSIPCARAWQWGHHAAKQPGSAKLRCPEEQHHLHSEYLQKVEFTGHHVSISSGVYDMDYLTIGYRGAIL